MIKVNNKSGGPDTRHLITRHQPTSGVYPIHRFNGNNKPTYHGLGNPTQNRPCPFVSWSKDHKVKAPTKSGPTIGLVNQPIPKHTTNGSLPTPPINTTNRRGGRRANRNNYGTATNTNDLPHPTKKQPMNFYITKGEPSQLIPNVNFVRKNKAIINVWENTVAVLSEKKARKCKKPILRKTIATSTVIRTHYYDSINTCPKTYITRIIKNINRRLMDQTTFHGQLIIK